MQGFTMAAILTFLRYVGSRGLIRGVDHEQRCHSKKIQNPSWANKKNQENPRSHFNTFGLHFWKKSYFSRQNPKFSRKNSISSPKISDDLFFKSSTLIFKIFTHIFEFPTFLASNLLFIPHFHPKNT